MNGVRASHAPANPLTDMGCDTLHEESGCGLDVASCHAEHAPSPHDERASPRPAHERAAQATRGVNSAVATGAGNPSIHFPSEPSGGLGKNIPGKTPG